MMPAQYHVRKLAQRVFQNSPALATSDGDLGKMSRPTFRRLEYDDGDEDTGSRSSRGESHDERRTRALRSERQDDDSATQEGLLHLQGFDPVVRMTNVEQRRGPRHPPDPGATRERRRRRAPRYQHRCKACGKFGHEESRCEFLAMYLYCTKWMSTRTEDDVKSVYEHWASRNQVDVAYDDVRQKVRDRGMAVNRMVEEMDWECFAPLTMEESFARDTTTSTTSQELSEDE